MAGLTPEIVIQLGERELRPRWSMRALRRLKSEHGLTMDQIDFNDPDQVVPFLLVGLQEVDPSVTEAQIEDGVDVFVLMRFGAELARLVSDLGLDSVPLPSPNGATLGPSLASTSGSRRRSSGH